MSALGLTIATPMRLMVETTASHVRAEDESGNFGILPGHADLITVLPASVVRWRGEDGTQHFCALRGGMLTVTDGARVAIACREGILGDDLAALESEVAKLRESEAEDDRRARVEQMRMHANAVRQLMRFLHPGGPGGMQPPPPIGPGGEP